MDLPSEDPSDGFGTVPLADGSKTNLFHTLCRFAVISAKVYNKLYSVRAARQSDGELLNTIGELDVELEAWKDSIPLDFRPEHELTALPPHLVIHIVILHFAYYNCLTTIHRRSVHHGYWTSRLSDYAVRGLNVKPLNPRVFSSAALCVSAARTSIHLIKYIPPGDYAFVWLILYYPVSALVTLFANILQNPQDVRARADLKLVALVVEFLHKIAIEDSTGSMNRMFSVCRDLERIAGLVLDRAEQEMTTRQKRKQEKEREKMAKRPQEPVEIPQPVRKSNDLQRSGEGCPQTLLQQQKQTQAPARDSTHSGAPPALNSSWAGLNTVEGQGLTPQQRSLAPSFMNDFSNNLPDIPNSEWPAFSSNGARSDAQKVNSVASPSFSEDFLATVAAAQQANSGLNAMDASTPGFDNPAFNFNWGNAPSQNSFQAPMVPQELWNMPMTFEWDWAEMINNGTTPSGVFDFSGELKDGEEATNVPTTDGRLP